MSHENCCQTECLGQGQETVHRFPKNVCLFTEAFNIVRAVETRLIAERRSDIRFFAYLQHLTWFPFKFLAMGVAEKTKSASLWAFLAFGFFILGAWIITHSGIARTEVATVIILASLIVPIFVVVFAMPSTYGNSGVTPSAVGFVAGHLEARGFSSTHEIDLLKKSIRLFEERSRARITVLKWLVGILWAGFVYTFSKASMATPAQSLPYIVEAAWLLLCLLAAYLAVWGYEASVDKLFRTVEFGCNNFAILRSQSEPPFHFHG